MTTVQIDGADRRRTLAVAEDAERITHLATELQRNAVELEGQSRKLRGTIAALESANEGLDRQAREIALAQAAADAATARLARLQRITAALSNTVTPDGVAKSVLREAMVALECDAAAVVALEPAGGLELLGVSGWLVPLMRSFAYVQLDHARGPYVEAVEKGNAIYLESLDRALARYPDFRDATNAKSRGAWIFLPLEIEDRAVGAMAFGFAKPRTFSEIDRTFADTVARYCAQALDRVRLRVAAATALTEAKDARLMAEHANSAKTLFLRGMSHELRTPLNAIAGFAALLEDGIRGPVNPAQVKDLGRIKRAAAYLLRLINDILTVAKLEGARPLHLATVAVNPVLAEVEILCAIQAAAKGLTFTVVPSPQPVLIVADEERLQQILLNLVTNAIKFTPRDGRITVTCELDAGMVRFDVRDTGVGIRPTDIDRVFEPFVQVNAHLTTPAQQGVGLGLSISRELARGMHGELIVQSTEGVGSTFTLTVPVATPAAVALTGQQS
jgi:signal transduction histidine kinase